MVRGTDTEGALYATNHEPLKDTEPPAYCMGRMGCSNPKGIVTISHVLGEEKVTDESEKHGAAPKLAVTEKD